jgi:hypothetical protein
VFVGRRKEIEIVSLSTWQASDKREAIRLRTAMMLVEAVVKMLEPGLNVTSIAAKRRKTTHGLSAARSLGAP